MDWHNIVCGIVGLPRQSVDLASFPFRLAREAKLLIFIMGTTMHHRCAVSNTVVGTVASASFAPGLATLARSAASVGFPCVVVMPFDHFPELDGPLISALPVPSPPLLPRMIWCTDPKLRNQYGWRRSQLHRARLWRVVIHLGLDLLAMDLDHMLGPRSPVPWLHSVYAPAEMFASLPATANAERPMPADVVAVWDGPGSRYLNVGIMWMRSTASTRALTLRAENRSFVGWEQQVFNEELNYGEDSAGVRCCHTRCLKRLCLSSNATRRLPAKSEQGTLARTRAEGADRCDDDAPPAAFPPKLSREPWAERGKWTPQRDVLRSKHHSNRKYGRCNHEFNVCVHVEPSTRQPTHWASAYAIAHGSLAMELPASNCSVPS